VSDHHDIGVAAVAFAVMMALVMMRMDRSGRLVIAVATPLHVVWYARRRFST
jgi:hypothetical protein